jgi:hypothetical protein
MELLYIFQGFDRGNQMRGVVSVRWFIPGESFGRAEFDHKLS